jgi:hypothetical protein
MRQVKHHGLSHIHNAERNRKVLLSIIRLSIATTKRLVDELISSGLVMKEEAGDRAGRGRKAASLRPNGDYGFAVGVSIEPGTEDRVSLEKLIMEGASKAIEACGTAHGPLLGVGAGIAGLVDAREGVVLYCPGLRGWEGAALASLLQDAFGTVILSGEVVRNFHELMLDGIQKTVRRRKLRLHVVKKFRKSGDPQFKEKLEDIMRLSLNVRLTTITATAQPRCLPPSTLQPVG